MSSGFHPFGGRVSKRFGDKYFGSPSNLTTPISAITTFDMSTALRMTGSPTTYPPPFSPTEALPHPLTPHTQAIAFWEEYLEHEKLKDFPKAKIVLLRPSMAFMLLQTREPLSLKSALPSFEHTTHIFLPVNDCRDVEHAEGGSHWSLLLVSVVDGVAFHYDSMCPSNLEEAKMLSHHISQLLQKPLKFVNLDDSPQQENGSDCGVFVCLLMQHLLLGRLLQAHAQDKVSMSMKGKAVDATGGRKEMLRVIEMFRKEGERRRS
ncbi:cysteine proteinase [Aureobasidium subglaciale]|nr:cysteine proteinase [Aureobasidium subglaciale]